MWKSTLSMTFVLLFCFFALFSIDCIVLVFFHSKCIMLPLVNEFSGMVGWIYYCKAFNCYLWPCLEQLKRYKTYVRLLRVKTAAALRETDARHVNSVLSELEGEHPMTSPAGTAHRVTSWWTPALDWLPCSDVMRTAEADRATVCFFSLETLLENYFRE